MSKAIIVHESGGPEVLKFEDRTLDAPGKGELLVRNTAIGVNFIDVYQRTGLYPMPHPYVAGQEGAGVVQAAGEGVTRFRPGDRVAYSGPTGAYAEERLLPASRAVPIPDEIDDDIAAAAFLKGLTVHYLFFLTHKLRKGETILFHAAAGGVGLIAGQWAHSLGVTVIGTAGSDEKAERALANGCDHVINYEKEDFAEKVRELTSGRGVDVVYDSVGRATFEKSLDCLRPRGLMVSFGNSSGPVSIPNLGVLAAKGSLFLTRPTGAHYHSTHSELLEAAGALFNAIADGRIRITIGQTFPLADAGDAHRALEGRRTIGSTILKP
jgi:NADPH2:quinone reductase